MEQVYIFTLSALFALAIFDLVVGVSNDAVNFLNSAFSSRAARLRTIMIVASIGVGIGGYLLQWDDGDSQEGYLQPRDVLLRGTDGDLCRSDVG